MMNLSYTCRRAALVGMVALLSVTLSACGGSSPTPAAEASGATASGKPLRIGSDISLAPWESFDSSNKPVGIDPDIAAALSKELGRPVEWINLGFASLIPSLSTGRFDVIMSGMSDRAARREALSFVDYATPYPTFMVAKGNPKNVKSINDLCGLTVVQTAGSATEVFVQEASKSCETAGKPSVNLVSVKTSADMVQAMKTGRAEVWLESILEHQNAVEALGDDEFQIERAADVPAPTVGIAVPKENTELLNEIQQALQKVIDKGELKKVAEKYKLPEDVFPTVAEVNKGQG